jgi:tetratricopeptide (TPR) repeat protein
MIRRSRCAAVAAFLAFAPALALPTGRDRWIEIRTPAFTVVSDATEDDAAEVARGLETLRATLAKVTEGMKLTTWKPIHVYAFRKSSQFREYAAGVSNGNKQLVGFHSQGLDRNVLAIDLGAGADALDVAHHEYLHEVLGNTFPGIPLWLNEGIAEYFSTFETIGGEAKIGRPVERHVQILRQTPMMPLRDLFAVREDDPAYNEQERAGVFYAQSWALVHYMLRGKTGRSGQLQALLSRLDEGMEPVAATTRSVGDVTTLETELNRYVRQTRFGFVVVPITELAVPEIPKATPLSRADALCRLGWLTANAGRGRDEEARRHFEAAIELEPSRADAFAGLGFLAARAGKRDVAAAALDKALAVAPDDPGVAFLAGMALLERAAGSVRDGDPLSAEVPADVARARELLEKVQLADPANVVAMAAYGSTFLFADEPPERGITAFEAALARGAGDIESAYALFTLYVRARERGKARELMERRLEAAAPAEIRLAARDQLLLLELDDARQLIEGGKPEEGLDLLRSMRDRAGNPAIRSFVEASLAEAESYVVRNREVDRYNRAVELANAGKRDEARALFLEVAGGPGEEPLKAAAKEAAERLVAAPSKPAPAKPGKRGI